MDLVLANSASDTVQRVLQLSHIRYCYPNAADDALVDVSLHLERGKILGLLGPNGAGKSTLISIIVGSRQADSGEHQSLARKMALVPQDYAFYPQLSCAENLRFFAQLNGHQGAQLAQHCDRAIDITQLEHVLKKPAHQLSGGLKRRLNLAIGLVADPDVLLLDEPTVGVDPQSRAYLLNAVRALASNGMSVLYTTHYMEEVQSICDQVAIMDHGRLLASGTVAQLLEQDTEKLVFVIRNAATIAFEQLPADYQLLHIDREECFFSSGRQEPFMPLYQWLLEQGAEVVAMRRGFQHLEQVFLQLTHHRLRD